MPHSLANIQVHLIFSTKKRRPYLVPDVEPLLYRYLGAVLNTCHCPPHQIGGAEDHIHISCSLGRTITVASLIEELKTNSSKWIKTQGQAYEDFAWQTGYGAFSIGLSQLEKLKHYIAGQRQHHRRQTFQEEFRAFLARYKIPYDERYVWD